MRSTVRARRADPGYVEELQDRHAPDLEQGANGLYRAVYSNQLFCRTAQQRLPPSGLRRLGKAALEQQQQQQPAAALEQQQQQLQQHPHLRSHRAAAPAGARIRRTVARSHGRPRAIGVL